MTDDTLNQAYDLIKSGDKLAARNLLGTYLKAQPDDEDGWTLLYYCVSRPQQKRQCLERVLQINPQNQKARQALAKLDAGGESPVSDRLNDSPSTAEASTPPDPQDVSPASSTASKPGAPNILRWILIALAGIVIAVFSLLIIYTRPTWLQSQAPTPTAALIAIQPSSSVPPTLILSPTHTLAPTFTFGPPPTEVLAPTAVVITFTPQPSNTPTITLVPSATLPPGARGNVQILDIHYYGNQLSAESDEYIVIGNLGNAPEDVTSWSLAAVSKGREFVFPKFTLQAGQSCRIYTNEVHEDTCGFSFQHESALWNNNADCARLFDSRGNAVDEYCYKRN
ncbi:lamin tail domain-containing protein [Chloroflexota bacterium]